MYKSKTLSKLMAWMLSLALAFSAAPVLAFAEDDRHALGESGVVEVPASTVVVTAFDELEEEIQWQGYDFGTALDALTLPDTLNGADTDGNPIEIGGVTWESEPAFDPEASAWYAFAPVLPEGYIPAEGVTAPAISVFIRPEGGVGIMPLATDANTLDLANPPNGGAAGTDGRYTVILSTYNGISVGGTDPITIIGDGTSGVWAVDITAAEDVTLDSTVRIYPQNRDGLRLPNGATIKGKGSAITITNDGTSSAIYSTGDITIIGEIGDITAGSSGIYTGGNITISGTVGNIKSIGSNGILSGGGVIISGKTGAITGNSNQINASSYAVLDYTSRLTAVARSRHS